MALVQIETNKQELSVMEVENHENLNDTVLAGLEALCVDEPVTTTTEEIITEGKQEWERTIIGKVITDGFIHPKKIRGSMWSAWEKIPKVATNILEANCMSFTFEEDSDLQWVLDSRPWLVQDYLLHIQKCNPLAPLSSLTFNFSHFWIHALNLPLALFTEGIGKNIGNTIGEFVEFDFMNMEKCFLRIKVNINIKKRLATGTWLEVKDHPRFWIPLRYEKLPIFCYNCGVIGHKQETCTSTPVKVRQEHNVFVRYGSWLKAETIQDAKRRMKSMAAGNNGERPFTRSFPRQAGNPDPANNYQSNQGIGERESRENHNNSYQSKGFEATNSARISTSLTKSINISGKETTQNCEVTESLTSQEKDFEMTLSGPAAEQPSFFQQKGKSTLMTHPTCEEDQQGKAQKILAHQEKSQMLNSLVQSALGIKPEGALSKEPVLKETKSLKHLARTNSGTINPSTQKIETPTGFFSTDTTISSPKIKTQTSQTSNKVNDQINTELEKPCIPILAPDQLPNKNQAIPLNKPISALVKDVEFTQKRSDLKNEQGELMAEEPSRRKRHFILKQSPQVVELLVHMDCEGCQRRIRKAIFKLEGVDSLDIDMDNQKVTVSGYVDQRRVLKAVRRTGRKAEFWPYPYDGEYHPYAAQYLEDSTYSSTYNYYRHGYNESNAHGYFPNAPHSNIIDDHTAALFNDENVHAYCSIM